MINDSVLSAELRRLAADLTQASERMLALAAVVDSPAATAASRVSREPSLRSPHLLTVPEVMTALGVGRGAVYDLIRSERLLSIKIGRSRRIRVEDLESFIRGNSAAPG